MSGKTEIEIMGNALVKGVQEKSLAQLKAEYRKYIKEEQGWDWWVNDGAEFLSGYFPATYSGWAELANHTDNPESVKLQVIAHPELSTHALISGLYSVIDLIQAGGRMTNRIPLEERLRMVEKHKDEIY